MRFLVNSFNPSRKAEILKKMRATCQKRGIWLPDDKLKDYALYRRKVYYFTYRSAKQKFSEEEMNKRKLCGVNGGWQIDHKFSIKEGFLNNIPPDVIGAAHNLELIRWEDNDSKKASCTITKDELMQVFERAKKEDNFNKPESD